MLFEKDIYALEVQDVLGVLPESVCDLYLFVWYHIYYYDI